MFIDSCSSYTFSRLNLTISGLLLTTQDDIGDKSVFIFNALPEEEKKALMQRLEAQSEQKFE